MEAEQISITRYDNTVPAFVGPELERLYGSVFSSLPQFETYGAFGTGISTYVARKGGDIITLLLFRIERGRVRVLNEVVRLDSKELALFADHIFPAFPVSVISFNAIETDIDRLAFPFQRFNCLEDLAMPLPGNVQEYLASLGKNTRRNVKRYMERLTRTFPSFRFETFEKDAIEERHVRDVIEFNHARMAEKNKQSSIDEEETGRIIRMAQACGMVGIATIDGRVVAGTISYRTGDNYYLYVLAHDPAYDDYWIGILCCYLTICKCIARGGSEFHFLWGRYDYKFTLGAVERELDRVNIYRSRVHMVLNGRTVLRALVDGYRRRGKLWLQYEAMHERGMVPVLASRLMNELRRLRRWSRANAGAGGGHH
jgi:hypothetical protein